MTVYILFSNWMHNGDNIVNEVLGIYDSIRKAQHSLCDCIKTDLISHPYEHISGDCSRPIEDYNIYDLAEMDYDDSSFDFDAISVRLWNGNEEYSEDYQYYEIEERPVF